ERACQHLLEVDVSLDRARQTVHREEREADERIVTHARREDARERAEAPPRRLELRDAARGVDAGVDDPDRAPDDRVGPGLLPLEVFEGADMVRAERGAPAEDENAFLPLGHARS